jgi:hypothetical protein
VLAKNPTMTNAELRTRLQNTAVDIGPPGRDDRFGYGLVNAFNAVNNLTGPTRAAYVRVVDATTGDTVRTVSVQSDGSYSVSRLAPGTYQVVAGEDESGDKRIGVPGRRFGWYGATGGAAPLKVSAGQTVVAPIHIGSPVESKPDNSFATATRVVLNSYVMGSITATDPASYFVVQLPRAGTYTFETSGVVGSCGFGLEVDTVLELYDATQVLKTRNDDSVFPGSLFCSQISTALGAGTYYVRVLGSRSTSSGQFRLSVRDQP